MLFGIMSGSLAKQRMARGSETVRCTSPEANLTDTVEGRSRWRDGLELTNHCLSPGQARVGEATARTLTPFTHLTHIL